MGYLPKMWEDFFFQKFLILSLTVKIKCPSMGLYKLLAFILRKKD